MRLLAGSVADESSDGSVQCLACVSKNEVFQERGFPENRFALFRSLGYEHVLMTSVRAISMLNLRCGAPKAAAVLLCLILPACAGGRLPGEQPAPRLAEATPPASPAPSATSAAPARAAAPAPAEDVASAAPPPGSASERAIQARADCWMKVEREKGLRDIDRRIAFVDKCVAGQL